LKFLNPPKDTSPCNKKFSRKEIRSTAMPGQHFAPFPETAALQEHKRIDVEEDMDTAMNDALIVTPGQTITQDTAFMRYDDLLAN
jgi:hypothetical protein